MDPVNPLGPILAAGFAIQQLLEILSPVFDWLFGETRKKIFLGIISLVIGFILAVGLKLHILEYFNAYGKGSFLDEFITALVISAGTEGINSVLKTVKYFKESQKTAAADGVKNLISNTGSQPTSEAAAQLANISPDILNSINSKALGNLIKLRQLEENIPPATNAFTKAIEANTSDALSYINTK